MRFNRIISALQEKGFSVDCNFYQVKDMQDYHFFAKKNDSSIDVTLKKWRDFDFNITTLLNKLDEFPESDDIRELKETINNVAGKLFFADLERRINAKSI